MLKEDIEKLLNNAFDIMRLFSILKKVLDCDSGEYNPLTEIIDEKIAELFTDLDNYETKYYLQRFLHARSVEGLDLQGILQGLQYPCPAAQFFFLERKPVEQFDNMGEFPLQKAADFREDLVILLHDVLVQIGALP